jgi:hypothetical protein
MWNRLPTGGHRISFAASRHRDFPSFGLGHASCTEGGGMKAAVVALLLEARGGALCDACLAHALGVDGDAVGSVTTELAALNDYLRDRSRCARCHSVASVTQAIVLPRRLPAAS